MSEQAQRAAVVAEAWTWARPKTPYHHHGRLKGVGVDCAMLLAEVYERAGVIEHCDPGAYAREWHLHRNDELYIGWLERCGAHEVEAPQPGDVALFRFGRTWSHGAIVVELGDYPLVIHSYIHRGCQANRLSEEPLAGRAPRYWSLW